MSSAAPPAAAMPPAEPLRRFTVAEYQRMIRAEILTDEDQVELLEGWIVPKMPRNPPHDAVLARLGNRVLGPRLPDGWSLRGQSAVVTSDSQPEPDLAVVRGVEFDYLARHPEPADMALVIEVADSTLHRDRTLKVRLYARAAIPVYWIVNLVDRRLEVYTDPTGPADEPAYRQRHDFNPGDAVPLVLAGQDCGTAVVAEFLP